MSRVLKEVLRHAVPMSIYVRRRPLTPQLAPARLADYLQALRDRVELPGTILEVGCFEGGATIVACRMLRDMGHERPYVCVDTFDGFVPDQFEVDVKHGTPARLETGFSRNPLSLFERRMRHFDFPVEAIQGDIVEIDAARLPDPISVCLMDVDLAVPIREGLAKVGPRMATGGVILVDDCDEATDWRGARVGYEEYMRKTSREPRYSVSGFGVVHC